jgi:hypothetical protein
MRNSKIVGEALRVQSVKKKSRPVAAAAGAKTQAARTASSRAPRKKPVVPAPTVYDPQMPDQGTIERMVAEAAYYLAEKRAFAPGFEAQDWQAAVDQIAAQLRSIKNPLV